jgi:hypothetical protein
VNLLLAGIDNLLPKDWFYPNFSIRLAPLAAVPPYLPGSKQGARAETCLNEVMQAPEYGIWGE